MSKEDIAEIYNPRWGIETNIDTLKNKFEIEKYSALKPYSIK